MTVASRNPGLFIAATVAFACTRLLAQEKAVEPTIAPPVVAAPEKLEIGQAAPALSIEHWVKGEPVKEFEKGKVYVVEFWATWCGPCRQSIPHLTKMQKDFKDKGVTIIGVSGQDKRGLEDVRPFVEAWGDKMNYTVAVDKEMGTTRAYMMATGRGGIPCAYVVDKQGKLAWYGHPMEAMDLVVEEVVEGKFDAAKHNERMSKFSAASDAFGRAYQAKDWPATEKALDDLAALRPDLATDMDMSRYWITRVGKKDTAAATSMRAALESRYKNDFDSLRKVSEMLVSVPEPDQAEQAGIVALAQKIVDKTEGKDVPALALLAKAYSNSGNWEKAIATQRLAITAAGAAGDEATKMNMEAVLNQMEADRKTHEKPAATDAPNGDAPKADAPKDGK